MKDLIDKIINDKTLTKTIKIEMLKEYRDIWAFNMATSTQEKEQFVKNNEILNIFNKKIEELLQ